MGIYQKVSPQGKIGELRQRLAEVQQELKDYEGEFSGMLGLLKESMQLSLKRVGYTFGPSLLAGLPAIGLLYYLKFSQAVRYEYIPVGPEWVGSWLTLFFIAVAGSALTMKFVFRIH